MRMNLKGKKEKIKIKITKKNFFLFLLIFIAISIILGIIFYIYLNSKDKALIKENIKDYFIIKDSYNYLKILKENLLENTKSIFIIWILGISIIGIILILFILFTEFFSIGFTITSIIDTYKSKSIFAIISYLFPEKIVFALLILILSFLSLNFSYKVIKLITSKEKNIEDEFKKYIKILIVFILLGIILSIIKTFITPYMIKFFTFFQK